MYFMSLSRVNPNETVQVPILGTWQAGNQANNSHKGRSAGAIAKPDRQYYYRSYGNTLEINMATVLTVKGQVTIPKPIRDALGLKPGTAVDFGVNKEGHVVILKAPEVRTQAQDRFEAARGKADIKWRTNELMALLRGDD